MSIIKKVNQNLVKVMFLLVFAVSILGCGSNQFKIIKDEVSISKYSKTEIHIGILNKRYFDQFVVYSRRGTVEDKDLSNLEKKDLLNIIDNLSYADNKYIWFAMVYNMPFMSDELDFKFNLTDSSGQEFIKNTYLIPTKIIEINEYGTKISYNYTWIIEVSPQIDSAHVNPSQLPLNLNIVFPDQKERVYSIDGV